MAVIALLAAALRPAAVYSLTVSEPGALRLAAGDPVVDQTIANGEELYRRAPRSTHATSCCCSAPASAPRARRLSRCPTGWSAAPAT